MILDVKTFTFSELLEKRTKKNLVQNAAFAAER